jgi:signal transduction histidine kinase
VFHSIMRTVLSTQLFIAVAAVSSLCLAALVSEREAFAERLGQSRRDAFSAAERERRRIERNLHDGAQQRLLALTVKIRLAAERARVARDPSQVDLVRAERELYLALDELRELSHGTHPSVLTALGLADAVRSVAARSTVPVKTPVLPTVRAADASEAVAYYVVAEAIANVQKHAHASEVVVQVAAVGDALVVDVTDDGIGGAGERSGGGLEGLRERVEACGGALRVQSPVGGGTQISAEIPA